MLLLSTVPIFNDVSRTKITVLQGCHWSCSRLGVPNLSRFAHLCSRMLTHCWPKISSDFICIYENIAGGRDSALDPAGGAQNAPPDLQVGLTSHLAIRSFGARPRLWSPNHVTLHSHNQKYITYSTVVIEGLRHGYMYRKLCAIWKDRLTLLQCLASGLSHIYLLWLSRWRD